MTEQWQELKETIIEMRDNNGTGTQQEVCKFLANYMEVLEKQTQEPCADAVSRQWLMECVNEGWIKFDTEKDRNRFIHLVRDIAPPVTPQPKIGHWIDEGIYADGQNYHAFRCSECEWHYIGNKSELVDFKYCPFCRAKMQEVI